MTYVSSNAKDLFGQISIRPSAKLALKPLDPLVLHLQSVLSPYIESVSRSASTALRDASGQLRIRQWRHPTGSSGEIKAGQLVATGSPVSDCLFYLRGPCWPNPGS